MLEGAALWPDVSVIVPVRNAARTLRPCLEALLAQAYPGTYEVFVVDNDSEDQTPALLAGYGDAIEVAFEPTRGASAARNRGIRDCRHELIAFIDADCVPRPSWLLELARAHRQNPTATLIGGRIAARASHSPMALWAERLFDQEAAIEQYRPPYVITANAMARRSDLIRIGLFDIEYLRSQDTELSFRAWFRHDARFFYASKAIVDHFNVETIAQLWRKALEHGGGAARIWRDFRADLGLSSTERMLDHRPYVKALRQLPRLASSVLERHDPRGDELYPLYDALFGLGKQVGFTWESLRRSAR